MVNGICGVEGSQMDIGKPYPGSDGCFLGIANNRRRSDCVPLHDEVLGAEAIAEQSAKANKVLTPTVLIVKTPL